jgi:hypothetical protein
MMTLEFTLADLFLLTWAIFATVMYFKAKHDDGFFKFKTAVIMKALAEGKAKFVKHADGEFEIVKEGE